ncbi:3'-5' exonuclease family protein, partial [Schaalia turicensis]
KTELLALFDTLEFGRLRNQVLAVSVGDDSVEESGNEADQAFWTAPLTVSVASAATDISGWARSVGHIDAIWADGEGIPAHGHIDLLALSAGSRVLVIDPTTLSPVQDQALVKVLKHSDSHVVHDAKALSHALAGHGWAMAWPSKDVQLAAYLARPDSKNVEIKEILNRYFNIELPEEEKKTEFFRTARHRLCQPSGLVVNLIDNSVSDLAH